MQLDRCVIKVKKGHVKKILAIEVTRPDSDFTREIYLLRKQIPIYIVNLKSKTTL